MAVLAAAQLLDELMGRNRNIAPTEKVKELHWEDPEYCKFFMVKFCPHDLFVNTRVDLGACSKVHDEEARKLFEKAKPHHKLYYQEEFIRYCTSMVNEVERKIQKGKIRLALSGSNKGSGDNGEGQGASVVSQKHQDHLNMLEERINKLEGEAEQCGTDGNVEQAQGLMTLCDQLKEERDQFRSQLEEGQGQQPQHQHQPQIWGAGGSSATAELAAAQEKQMEVCEVCGAFLIVGDAQQRIDDHLMGKQHMGYSRLKAALDEISAVVKATREERTRSRRDDSFSASNEKVGERRSKGVHDRDKRRNREDSKEKDRRDRSERRDRDNHQRSGGERSRDRDSGRKHHHSNHRQHSHRH